MYLFDTNHCSKILQGHNFILEKLKEIDNSLMATCTIVCGELFYMVNKSQQKESNLSLVEEFLGNIQIYSVDYRSAQMYGELKISLFEHFGPKEKSKRRGTKLESLGFKENDLWIAAIAKSHELIIVSADSDFKRMQEAISLEVEQW